MSAAGHQGASVQRLAIVAPAARALLRSRAGLIRAVLARGHRVMVVAPSFSPAEQASLAALGVERSVATPTPPPSRFLKRRQDRAALAALLKDWQPHVGLGFGGTPAIEAALAAKDAGIARIVTLINEWPLAAIEDKRELARALDASHAVVCHNVEQARTLADCGALPPGRKAVIVPGSGVDLERFAAAPLPPPGTAPVFLMLSRLERARGVLDYAAAARLFRLRHPQARFLLAGPAGTSPGAVTGDEIVACAADVEYLGDLDDVRPVLAQCHVYVYPSHGEGMPASVLEALAVGRAVVGARVPGTREAVDEGVNGTLVPVNDVAALVDALEAYVKWPDLIVAGARASRAKAERAFDERDVMRGLFATLQLGG